ncbi:hypothetical protein G8764_04530 [Pseudomaricurvus alcaniphilus]|uniref:hypothetical protein n=1 Tax=Pseudomaricurvus alcaniphilus TaxID=1166482 RepID=UPI00140D5397|nr:hypothetical protein [Pseudomaricurvus alcaniphilus]NHN36555.1 hypothetical protein [Pseudomaricurvus alcaniphilus]
MSRIVKSVPGKYPFALVWPLEWNPFSGHGSGAKATADVPGEQGKGREALERVAQYVPVEVLATYVTVSAAISKDTQTEIDAAAVKFIGWWLLCLFLAIPLYFRQVARQGEAWGRNALVSMAAFVIWTYAIEASLWQITFLKDWHDPDYAAIFIGGFTFITAFTAPGKQ